MTLFAPNLSLHAMPYFAIAKVLIFTLIDEKLYFKPLLYLIFLEHCVYGDSVVPHLNRTCKDEINEDPNRCKEESIKDRCCASCAGKRKRNRGEIEYYYKIIYSSILIFE